jgi:hypothetical protein
MATTTKTEAAPTALNLPVDVVQVPSRTKTGEPDQTPGWKYIDPVVGAELSKVQLGQMAASAQSEVLSQERAAGEPGSTEMDPEAKKRLDAITKAKEAGEARAEAEGKAGR